MHKGGRGVCDEKVSNAEKVILNALVQGMYDVEAREEILSKEPQLDLTARVIEGKETGRRSAGILWGGTPAIGQANKAAVMVEDHKHGTSKGENCKCCGRQGHGISPNLKARKKSCPAWKKESSNC